MRDTLLVISALFVFSTSVNSQTIEQPNVALKSHQTLEILKIDLSPVKTEIYMTIENRISGGNFCADRNIFLTDNEGNSLKLIKADGIPLCPERFNFKSIGERLNFKLTFPPLKKGTSIINIREDCTENCFSFYGIILDHDINKKLDEIFSVVDKGEPINAVNRLIEIAEDKKYSGNGVESFLYINIIELATETGNTAKAAVWYKKLLSLKYSEKDKYIKYLNDRGIIY